MVQDGKKPSRRGRPARGAPEDLPWAMKAWVTELQAVRKNLTVTYVQLEEHMGAGSSTSTLARIFSGQTLPSGPRFIDLLCQAIETSTRRPVPQKIADTLRGLYLEACREQDPQRAEVEELKRELAEVTARANRTQETVSVLRRQLSGTMREQLPPGGQEPHPGREVTPDEVLTRSELLDQEMRDELREMQRLAAARDEIDRRLRAAEDRLNARLAREWEQIENEARLEDAPPRLRSGRDGPGEPAPSPFVGDTEAVDRREQQITKILTESTRRMMPLAARQMTLLPQGAPAAHLAARMQRIGENLASLTGEPQSRMWPAAVPVAELLKRAVQTIEDYERIDLRTLDAAVASVQIVGRIATDVSTLLAELLENAASFSSPRTTVTVDGELVGPGPGPGPDPGSGLRLFVHDVGIGMPADELKQLNKSLASPPIHTSTLRRLGLLTAGIIAVRHTIHVKLSSRTTGGTTASIHLPAELIAPSKGGEDAPGTD